ncbi:TPA: ankyrin repeat domain-containing protein, partial [Legionella anisa]
MYPIEKIFDELARSALINPLLAVHYQKIVAAYEEKDFAILRRLLELGIQSFDDYQSDSLKQKKTAYIKNLIALKEHFVCADDKEKNIRSYKLMRAITLENIEELKQSIENQGGLAIISTPLKPFPSSNEELTPLQHALKTKNPAIILLIASFLNKSALEGTCNDDGETLLHFAAKNGWQDIVVFLLSKNVFLTPKRNTDESTPLHLACRYGHQAIAQLLINRGADIHAKSKVNTKKGVIETSVLSDSIYSSSTALVMALLAQGARVDAVAYNLAKSSVKNSGSSTSTIRSHVLQPFKEQKNNIIQRGSVKEKLGEKIQEFHPIVQQILSQVYTEDAKNDELIAKKLNEILLSDNKILKPLFYIMAWATQDLHKHPQKPLEIIIADAHDIT